MDAKDRIIVALDVDRPDRATELVSMLTPHVGCFKIGFEFITATYVRLATYDWETSLRELRVLQRLFAMLGDKLFWDGKFHDIPNTVGGASKPVAGLGIKMFNVHAAGGTKMMKAALAAAEEMKVISPTGKRPLVIAVTALTSLEHSDLVDVGFYDDFNIEDPVEREQMERGRIERLVRKLALLAQDAGLDGVVCSPKELTVLRHSCQPEFKLVTPGIRASDAPPDDQKRTMTPAEAITAGADYLVIGRPITKAANPVDAAKSIADEIDAELSSATQGG